MGNQLHSEPVWKQFVYACFLSEHYPHITWNNLFRILFYGKKQNQRYGFGCFLLHVLFLQYEDEMPNPYRALQLILHFTKK